jgi:hypothetical protein
MTPKKPAPDFIRDGNRFSDKNMLDQKDRIRIRFHAVESGSSS